MPDENQVGEEQVTPAAESTGAESTSTGTAPEGGSDTGAESPAPAKKATARKTAAKKAPAKKAATKRTAAKKSAAAPVADEALPLEGDVAPAESAAEESPAPARKAAKKAPAKKAAARKATAKKTAASAEPDAEVPAGAETDTAGTQPESQVGTQADAHAADTSEAAEKPAKKAAAKKSAARRATAKKPAAEASSTGSELEATATEESEETAEVAAPGSQAPLFQPPVAAKRTTRSRKAAAPVPADEDEVEDADDLADDAEDTESTATQVEEQTDGAADDTADDQAGVEDGSDEDEEGGSPARRRRRRGGRRRRRGGSGGQGGGDADASDDDPSEDTEDQDGDTEQTSEPAEPAEGGQGEGGQAEGGQGEGSGTSRRRRRRRRSGDGDAEGGDEPSNTVTRVRSARSAEDQITSLSGSTRLEAKKQRRREGREAGRRRAPIVSEAEFLARRESVERVMVIREREDLTQIAVLEDKVLVEHYVARESQTSLIGNVYLGRVQNVLPSMEAAFVDIGKGRNAVLYAGEVNWSALGHKEGQPRKIESFLSSGQSVLVQVTKDPVGHKGARLTSQVSLAGRFLVYVPDGTTSGISRKLPDTERSRLKALLKEIVPDTAGVIVRTAAEGASEEELTQDVERLKARWEDIEKKAKGSAPQLLYGEPDLTLKVVRDLFTEDFSRLVIQGQDAWDTVQGYVTHVAPDLAERLERFEPATEGRDAGKDVFATYRVDEQIAKGLDRKVWLPSGGSLVIDRTEAMTVVDVNTGKFTGSGGNLEETVTKNNLEAAEEIVRQLRLRDIGGIIVVDFIDMVLESNRDLVLRRLVECLGRDRTRHQVAEVTSLGLVQMTRKRIGTGLLEAFSENCPHCQGRGVVVHDQPVEVRGGGSDDDRGGRGGGGAGNGGSKRSRGGRGKASDSQSGGQTGGQTGGQPGGGGTPSPKDIAAMPRHENADEQGAPADQQSTDREPAETSAEKSAEKSGREPGAKRDRRSAQRSGQRSDQAPDGEQPTAREATVTESAAPETGAREAARTEDRAEDRPEVQPEAEKPAKPAASSGVVTRTRRAARRTGPLTTGEGAAVVVEATTPAAPEQPAEPAAPAPKVVTRTRSSRASRPAAQATQVPSGDQADAPSGAGEAPASDRVEPGTAEAEPAPASVEHVPVKRKGSRKR